MNANLVFEGEQVDTARFCFTILFKPEIAYDQFCLNASGFDQPGNGSLRPPSATAGSRAETVNGRISDRVWSGGESGYAPGVFRKRNLHFPGLRSGNSGGRPPRLHFPAFPRCRAKKGKKSASGGEKKTNLVYIISISRF